ncbi:hypothetical protein DRO19_00320 [Candidatus Bathyarchaeota archaeon]|nr:MAG: hypothetical protein DRO19_00320 [Candidatus Bathyarchaeota archaeon]
MPIIKKLVDLKTCRAIILPAEWLKYYEQKFGGKIESVAVEINDVLKIRPIPPKEASNVERGRNSPSA